MVKSKHEHARLPATWSSCNPTVLAAGTVCTNSREHAFVQIQTEILLINTITYLVGMLAN